MAFDVGIHLWFDQPNEEGWARLFRECLRASLGPTPPATPLLPNINVGLRLCRRSENSVVSAWTIPSADVPQIADADLPSVRRDSLLQADLGFPCVLYSAQQQQLEETVHPLSIRLAGPEFDVDGYEYKRNGLVRFSFSNIKVFGVPPELVEHTRAAVPAGQQDRYLRMISRISRNYDVVLDVARKVIERLDPSHLLICTELEVHPLTAHALYHRQIEDFLGDLNWIADLHERGGLYLCSEQSGHLMPPRRESGDYGYLRVQRGSVADVVSRLEHRLQQRRARGGLNELSGDDVRLALSSGAGRTVEAMRDSIIVCAEDGPFAYVEDPLFDLFDLANSTTNTQVH
ncbi:MAG: hypothetical protein ACKV22_08115 [Bryobacteraceae bacterium]